MAKAVKPSELVRARRELLKSGANEDLVKDFELSLLREVMHNSSISGNASDYTLARIAELEA